MRENSSNVFTEPRQYGGIIAKKIVAFSRKELEAARDMQGSNSRVAAAARGSAKSETRRWQELGGRRRGDSILR